MVMRDTLDIPATLASLDLEREDDCPSLSWLDQSRTEPERFWDGACHWIQLTGRGVQTRRFAHYDLYLDLVERHRGSSAPAMLWCEGDRLRTMTFDELGSRALRCAESWSKLGVRPGVRVALALPLGCDYLVAFCALLCLGASVTIVDAAPSQAMARQVQLCRVTMVVRPEFGDCAQAIEGVTTIRVTVDGRPRTQRPYAYQAQEPCWWTLSPLSRGTSAPVSAHCVFEASLLDAIYALRLDARSRLAVPGWSLRQCQPSLLSSCLLAGCAFVHLTLEQLQNNPELLFDSNLTCLGLSQPLLRSLGEWSRPLATVKHLVRPVDEPLDWSGYRGFLTRTELTHVPCSSLLMDAALGGSVLFSTRRKGTFGARVLPSVGRRFSLVDSLTKAEDVANAGVLQLRAEPRAMAASAGSNAAEAEAFLLLVRHGNEWFYGGTIQPRRGSHCFPDELVVACVERLSGVAGACIVPVPQVTDHGFWTFCLLLFTGSVEAGPSIAAVASAIRSELGAEALPDHIEVVPFHPRRAKRRVDVAWYERRYQTGSLGRLLRASAYRALGSLRSRLTVSSPLT